MARVLDIVKPEVLRAILVHWYGFSASVNPTDVIEDELFFIGRSQDRYEGRCRLKVTYRLKRPPESRPRRTSRDVSRRRSLYCWIGASTSPQLGISLFLGKDRPPFRPAP